MPPSTSGLGVSSGVDEEGHLKVVYPSKMDLDFAAAHVTVLR